MRFIICNDYDEMSRKAAEILAECIIEIPFPVLGLATGSTPEGLYKCLVDMYKKGEISFAEVKTFNLDEYCGIDPENEQSYISFMKRNLFDKVDINPNNAHVPEASKDDSDSVCENYEKMIQDAGGIDIQLLGLGNNGHIGFNEPADNFSVMTHKVKLAGRTIEANSRFFDSEDDVPKEAITMGIGTIMKARRILVVANGKGKADIVKKAFFGPVVPEVPASVLQLHPEVDIVLDEEAASELDL